MKIKIYSPFQVFVSDNNFLLSRFSKIKMKSDGFKLNKS